MIFFLFQLKVVQVNSKLEIIVHAEVKFDTDLPEFRTTGGVNCIPNTSEYEFFLA